MDVDYEDLKSPGGNTVWVRPPPALPSLREQNSQVFVLEKALLNSTMHRGMKPVPCFPDARPVPPGHHYP